jgi:hypothetical protein
MFPCSAQGELSFMGGLLRAAQVGQDACQQLVNDRRLRIEFSCVLRDWQGIGRAMEFDKHGTQADVCDGAARSEANLFAELPLGVFILLMEIEGRSVRVVKKRGVRIVAQHALKKLCSPIEAPADQS